MGHETEQHVHNHTEGVIAVKDVLHLLTLWGKHMASIDEQLKALSDKFDAFEKPADISGLQADVTALKAQAAANGGSLSQLNTKADQIGGKLGADTFVPAAPTP